MVVFAFGIGQLLIGHQARVRLLLVIALLAISPALGDSPLRPDIMDVAGHPFDQFIKLLRQVNIPCIEWSGGIRLVHRLVYDFNICKLQNLFEFRPAVAHLFGWFCSSRCRLISVSRLAASTGWPRRMAISLKACRIPIPTASPPLPCAFRVS